MSSGKSGRCHMTKVLFGCQILRKQLRVGVPFYVKGTCLHSFLHFISFLDPGHFCFFSNSFLYIYFVFNRGLFP